AVLTLAIGRKNGRGDPSHSQATGSLLSSSAAGPPSVTLIGQHGTVDRPTTLKAAAKARSGRVVAVTFLLDGVPLGSDTKAPYSLALDPGLVPWGRHRLTVARGRGIAISDLTVDGGGPGPGRGIAVAVFDGSRNVRLSRLRLIRVRTDGVNVWGAYSNVSVQDSLIDGDGGAQTGVFALGS